MSNSNIIKPLGVFPGGWELGVNEAEQRSTGYYVFRRNSSSAWEPYLTMTGSNEIPESFRKWADSAIDINEASIPGGFPGIVKIFESAAHIEHRMDEIIQRMEYLQNQIDRLRKKSGEMESERLSAQEEADQARVQ